MTDREIAKRMQNWFLSSAEMLIETCDRRTVSDDQIARCANLATIAALARTIARDG